VCSPSCVPQDLVQLDGFYNPLAIPLLNGWTRCACVCLSVCVCGMCEYVCVSSVGVCVCVCSVCAYVSVCLCSVCVVHVTFISFIALCITNSNNNNVVAIATIGNRWRLILRYHTQHITGHIFTILLPVAGDW